MRVPRTFSRSQRTPIVQGMLAFVLILVVLQLWLLTATMNAYLGKPALFFAERRPATLPAPTQVIAVELGIVPDRAKI